MYALIWHSKYGKEEIDETEDLKNAEYLKNEYTLAYGQGYIEIKKINRKE